MNIRKRAIEIHNFPKLEGHSIERLYSLLQSRKVSFGELSKNRNVIFRTYYVNLVTLTMLSITINDVKYYDSKVLKNCVT